MVHPRDVGADLRCILKIEFFQPLAALLGSSDGVAFFGSDNGTLVVSIIVIVLTSFLVALGMAGYARIQRMCLYLGLIGFGIMAVLMAVSSQADFQAAFDRVNQSMFGVSGAYDKTIADAAANDAFTGSLDPLAMGADIGATLTAAVAMLPFMLFWILYPNWGSTLYGEVRGSGDFRKVLNGMLGGIWVTAALAIVFVLLAAKTFGWLFFNATNVNFINWFYGYTTTDPTVPIWSYPPLLASYLIDSHDLPDRDGRALRRLVPRLVRDVVPVVDADDLRGGVRSGPARAGRPRVGGARCPHRGAPVHHDPGDRRQRPVCLLGGFPSAHARRHPGHRRHVPREHGRGDDPAVVEAADLRELADRPPEDARSALSSLIISVILAYVIFLWLSDPLYGIGVGNTNSIVFLGVLYGAAAILYVAARLYRRAQGVDLDAIHGEIPAE